MKLLKYAFQACTADKLLKTKHFEQKIGPFCNDAYLVQLKPMEKSNWTHIRIRKPDKIFENFHMKYLSEQNVVSMMMLRKQLTFQQQSQWSVWKSLLFFDQCFQINPHILLTIPDGINYPTERNWNEVPIYTYMGLQVLSESEYFKIWVKITKLRFLSKRRA